MWLSSDRAFGKTQKTVNEERQRENHQRVELKRGDWVKVQQVIKGPRRAATRTLATSNNEEGTLGKELVGRARGVEEEEESGAGG